MFISEQAWNASSLIADSEVRQLGTALIAEIPQGPISQLKPAAHLCLGEMEWSFDKFDCVLELLSLGF